MITSVAANPGVGYNCGGLARTEISVVEGNLITLLVD